MSLIPAPARYKNTPANPSLVYDTICKVLSERADQVAWDAFTPDDWQLLVMMAETEGVAPLLYWKMRPSAPAPGLRNMGGVSPVALKGGRMKDELPSTLYASLAASYYQTAARNALRCEKNRR